VSTFLVFDDRPSESPFIERVWHCHSERAGTMHSVASPHWGIVVTRYRGRTKLTVRGPETRMTAMECPANGEWMGILFKLGTFMPEYPVGRLRDGRDVDLPSVSKQSFLLDGANWEIPSFENAESFVKRLIRGGLVSRDPAVEAALAGERQALSKRSAQRHFLYATGMTQGTFRKIERARYATNLLRDGMPIAEVVHEAGYFDQAHLTRSLRALMGETPAQIGRQEQQLSFLYKTERPR
jgi:AraC-like DNA-binding protein